jgi:hypothetical protein
VIPSCMEGVYAVLAGDGSAVCGDRQFGAPRIAARGLR